MKTKYRHNYNTTSIIQHLLDIYAPEIKIAVDMTLGNGKDALSILKRMSNGFLYGFDIQEDAIKNTKELLEKFNYENFKLIQENHVAVDKYIDKADLFIYNLGYLPGGDKKIRTSMESTVESLKKIKERLLPGGIILMTVYIGHSGGIEEYMGIQEEIKQWDQNEFSILEYRFLNHKKDAPFVITIERAQ